jgi:hypothetical protein
MVVRRRLVVHVVLLALRLRLLPRVPQLRRQRLRLPPRRLLLLQKRLRLNNRIDIHLYMKARNSQGYGPF